METTSKDVFLIQPEIVAGPSWYANNEAIDHVTGDKRIRLLLILTMVMKNS